MVPLVDRYGDAVEFDLHRVFGLDLVDFFRGRHSWRKLEALVAQLGRGTRFWAARAADPEAADEWLKAHPDWTPDAKADPPPLEDMTLSNELLMLLADRLASIEAVLAWLGGERPAEPPSFPRPTTALTAARHRADAAGLDGLLVEALAAQQRQGAVDSEPGRGMA